METLTLLLVLLVLGLWMLGAYNRLVRLRNNCTSLFTQVEQRARERHGLVDQLAQVLRSVLADQRGQVEIAAAAARQAGQALEATRQRPVRAGAVEQLSRAEEVLDQALSQLDEALRHHVSQQDASPLTPSDAAPITHLAELLTQLDGVQSSTDFARQVYNQAAHDYNAALGLFPTTVVAGLFRFTAVALMPAGRSRS